MTAPVQSTQAGSDELARKAALFREGTRRIYECQGDKADMWFFELWHFLGDVQTALSIPSTARVCPDCGKREACDDECPNATHPSTEPRSP